MPTTTVDRQGLTSLLTPPRIAPARVRFRDAQTGAWLHGVSEPKIDINSFRMELALQAYTPCPYEGRDRWHATVRRLRRLGQLVGWPVQADAAHCPICATARELD